MEEQLLEGLRSLERQAVVTYVTVSDSHGYPIATSGGANKLVAAYVTEVNNCVQEIFPSASNAKIVVEGGQKSVIIGKKEDFIVGVQIAKDMF